MNNIDVCLVFWFSKQDHYEFTRHETSIDHMPSNAMVPMITIQCPCSKARLSLYIEC